jgi:hypothetical protein
MQGGGAIAKESVMCPVVGIKRAISVAAGADHTLVLTATTLPELPLALSDMFAGRCPLTGCPLKADPTQSAGAETGGRGNVSAIPEQQLADSEIAPDAFLDMEEQEDNIEEHASVASDDDAQSQDDGTGVPSLLSLCERQVAKTVNVKTAISALTFADQFCAPLLAEYCICFIQR